MTNSDWVPRYHIYLLTIWEERNQDAGAEAVLRFRLENPSSGQQRGFTSLEPLVAALEQELADWSHKDPTK
ncbi:MAG: hypothetical protein PVG32_21590 [Anaerolineales bacterium]|jgi:hypothetical protein